MTSAQPKRRNRTPLWVGIAAAIILAAVVFALTLPNATNGSNYSVIDNKVTIHAANIDTLGTVLVTDKGFALYAFLPDAQQSVTCYDRCARNWPPIFLNTGVSVIAGAGVDSSLLGQLTDKNGRQVATYNGWPLYLYTGDVVPGTANGHRQYLDGGYWYVIRPNGEVETPVLPG